MADLSKFLAALAPGDGLELTLHSGEQVRGRLVSHDHERVVVSGVYGERTYGLGDVREVEAWVQPGESE